MRHAPAGAAQRRRLGRLLRSIDVYVVFAVLGVIAYIVVVNLMAEVFASQAQQDIRTQLSLAVTEGGAVAQLPAEVYWPYRWPAKPPAEISILRDGREYVESSLARLAPLMTRRPDLQLAAWDLLLLTGKKTFITASVAELRRVVAAALSSPSPSVAAVREAVESAAAVWAVKGMTAEVEEAQHILGELSAAPSLAASTPFNASSWEAFSAAVWSAVTAAPASHSIVDLQHAVRHLVNVSGHYWAAAQDGGVLPLYEHRLLPLRGGTHDAVVPLTRLLLHLWILGGRAETSLVALYDEAVEQVIRDLLHTRTVATGNHAMNFTFVASAAEAVVPVATPRTCALAGVLAQGVRLGAHRYTNRPTSARYSEDDILQAAEALAASCFQQYVDPAGHRLRGAVYVSSAGPAAGYAVNTSKSASALRSTACDVPGLLLDAFHELYLVTQDAMYGVWSLVVMSSGTSDHCGVSARDLGGEAVWLRYVRELRSLWLLLQRMDCLLYRRSPGTRGLCDVTATTMVSSVTGHLRRLPREEA